MKFNKEKDDKYPTFVYYHESNESFIIELKEDFGFAHLLANSLDKAES